MGIIVIVPPALWGCYEDAINLGLHLAGRKYDTTTCPAHRVLQIICSTQNVIEPMYSFSFPGYIPLVLQSQLE